MPPLLPDSHKYGIVINKGHDAIWAILKLEDIMVLNNMTKFHRIIIKTVHLREQTSFQPTIVHKLRAITP